MTDRDALLAAICAHPDEDTPRLAFADWLQEQGGKENTFRAEYIRGAIRVAREDLWSPAWHAARKGWAKYDDKVRKLLLDHKLEWVKHLEKRARAFELERGFVGHLTVFSKRFVAEGDKFFADDPIRSVKFVKLTAASGTVPAKELFACPHLARVSKLALDESELTDSQLGLMIASPHLKGVRCLSLGGHQRFTPRGLVNLIQKMPIVRELLMQQSGHFGDQFATALAGSPALGKLQVLDLHEHRLGAKALAALLATKHGANLWHLRLAVGFELDEEYGLPGDQRRFRKKDGKEVAAVLGKCKFPNVRWLDASGWRMGDAGLISLAEGGGFPSLRWLRVEENDLTPVGIRALAASPLGKQLVLLSVGFDEKLQDAKLRREAKKLFPNATVEGLPL